MSRNTCPAEAGKLPGDSSGKITISVKKKFITGKLRGTKIPIPNDYYT
jgi:hypothetical protein